MQRKESVHQLNNDYVRRLKESEAKRHVRLAALSQRRRGRALRILAVFAVALVICLWSYGQNMASLRNIRNQTATTSQQLDTAKKKNGQLTQEVKQLHSNDYLSQLVRGKYLYTKNGEVVYNLPKDAK